MENDSNLHRRKYLKSVGATAIIGTVAGCTGGSDGSGDQNGSDGSAGSGGSEGNGESGGQSTSGGGDSNFPQEDITIIIPYGTGGSYDEYTRLIAPYLEKHLPNDVNVIPQNVSGAGGRVGTEQYYNADPDGYTIGMINRAGFSLTQVMRDVRYDLTEMTHFAQISQGPQVIAASTETDVVTFDDYISAVESEEMKFTSLGPGTSDIVVPSALGALSGLYEPEKVLENTVTYDGAGQAFQGMLAGDVQLTGRGYYSAISYLQSGDVRYVVVGTDEPPEESPEAITVNELKERDDIDNPDLLEYIFARPRSFAGPPDIPEDRARILSEAFENAAKDEEFVAAAEEAQRPVQYLGPEETAEGIEQQVQIWRDNMSLSEKLLPPQ